MSRIKSAFLVAALAIGGSSGCYGTAEVGATAVIEPAPRIVSVGPGVWVVEDYDYPLFWYEGTYWVFYDGIWYRSDFHTGAWVHVHVHALPAPLVRIRYPSRYVRYRAPRGAPVRQIRDHRRPPREAPPRYAPQRRPEPRRR